MENKIQESMKEKELQRQAVLDAIQDLNVKFREK